jgi:hypothetical protein
MQWPVAMKEVFREIFYLCFFHQYCSSGRLIPTLNCFFLMQNANSPKYSDFKVTPDIRKRLGKNVCVCTTRDINLLFFVSLESCRTHSYCLLKQCPLQVTGSCGRKNLTDLFKSVPSLNTQNETVYLHQVCRVKQKNINPVCIHRIHRMKLCMFWEYAEETAFVH